MHPAGAGPELSAKDFSRVQTLLYGVSGIKLGPGKEGLVRARLTRRLRAAGVATFAEYLGHVEREGARDELAAMVDALTTNKTSFFRESTHFDLFAGTLLPRLAERGGAVRVWSAGCSSGEEPYTLAMLAHETLGPAARTTVRILATDISARVLAQARAGIYTAEQLADVPPGLAARYLSAVPDRPGSLVVRDALRELVAFARLNLMASWPMRGPFDAIFCRNVMIYFDRDTQERLVNRYYDLLAPGGHLFVGHSESLTALTHRFSYVCPAVYRK